MQESINKNVALKLIEIFSEYEDDFDLSTVEGRQSLEKHLVNKLKTGNISIKDGIVLGFFNEGFTEESPEIKFKDTKSFVENKTERERIKSKIEYYLKIGESVDPTTGETTTSVYNRDFAGVAHGSDPTALSYIYAYGSPGEKVIDTERIKIVDSSNTGVYWNESGLTASKLYKITIDATGDVHSDGAYSGTISFTLSDGTFTGYKTGITTTGAIYLRAGNNTIPGTTYYDNLKVEEVTSNTGVLL